jgi:hypothetical protein
MVKTRLMFCSLFFNFLRAFKKKLCKYIFSSKILNRKVQNVDHLPQTDKPQPAEERKSRKSSKLTGDRG